MFRKQPPLKPKKNTFLDRVQSHERAWGNDSYANKPDLTDILQANVVVFWLNNDGKDPREKITLHADTSDVEFLLAKQVLRSNLQAPRQRLKAIYQAQKQLRIKAFRIIFEPIDP